MTKEDSSISTRRLKEEDVPSVRSLCRAVQSASAREEFLIHLRRFLTSFHVIVTPVFFFCFYHFYLKTAVLPSLKSCIQTTIICEGVRFLFFWWKIKGVFKEGEDLKEPLRYFDHPKRAFLVAVVDGHIAGTVGVKETEDPNVAKLYRMFVHPSYRRRGIALRLISAIHNESRKLKYRSMSLRTHTTNQKALRCYEKAGYTLVEQKNYASVYPHSFDTVIYVKDLREDGPTI
ncbi:uncharacterized protein [Palaemon carinicauda]|uniref:uncharacterized protein n=1 Tax=Palaemon carinicauda TaxID=392227 RepID=UPI0035B656A9